MEKDKDYMYRHFREKLANYEQEPEKYLWNRISSKLGHRKNNHRILFFFKIAAGLTLLASTGLGYYWINKEKPAALTAPVSIVQEVKLPGDSALKNRPAKSDQVKGHVRSPKKSDRLEPVRKLQKIPLPPQEEKSTAASLSKEILNETHRNYPDETNNNQYLTTFKMKEGKVFEDDENADKLFFTAEKQVTENYNDYYIAEITYPETSCR